MDPVMPVAPVEPAPLPAETAGNADRIHFNFAGSIQLDYMRLGEPSGVTGRKRALDGASAEASIKLTVDYHKHVSASVKACFACHGFDVGMAYFELNIRDELNVRVGRFSPAFGEFPLRHDPANHRTSDKPLPYDMGRMVRLSEWNEGVLPAPWVDNGIQVHGTHFFGEHLQADYAVYGINGPRASSSALDFDFKQSRSGEAYYIDNNSRPVFGGQLVLSLIAGATSMTLGGSVMRGSYDDDHRLPFSIVGGHIVFRRNNTYLRFEYLMRRTRMGNDGTVQWKYGPRDGGTYDLDAIKDGGYAELEIPLTDELTFVAREDGLRRRGNVPTTSALRKDSAVLRHTAAIALEVWKSLRIKLSFERYDFSDFDDESVVHAGLAGPF